MELNNVTSVREMLECMPTETLKEILTNELRKEPIDDNAIRMIMDILRERHKDEHVKITPNIQKAWEKYQMDSGKIWGKSRRSRNIYNWTIKVVATAAVFTLLLISIVPKHVSAKNFWQKIASWTSDLFGFSVSNMHEFTHDKPEFQTEIRGLQQVYDAVKNIGITTPVVPTWLPDAPELIECKTILSPAKDTVKSVLGNSSGEIVICVSKCHTDVDHRYHKDDTAVNLFEINGVNYNIMSNNTRLIAAWLIENIECSITIDCQEDVLIKILESIYVMEAN